VVGAALQYCNAAPVFVPIFMLAWQYLVKKCSINLLETVFYAVPGF
jgi:hypothetical protein